MNEVSSFEFVVKQKIEGKWLLARIGLFAFYILYVIGMLIAGILSRILVPFLALIPISLWIIVFITWRYVSVEYEYALLGGTLTFTKIFGGRSRKKIFSVPLRDACRIAPLEDSMAADAARAYRPEREFSAISSLKAPDIYFMLFEWASAKGKEKRRAIFYFEATAKTLHICRYYNPSATQMTKTTR